MELRWFVVGISIFKQGVFFRSNEDFEDRKWHGEKYRKYGYLAMGNWWFSGGLTDFFGIESEIEVLNHLKPIGQWKTIGKR